MTSTEQSGRFHALVEQFEMPVFVLNETGAFEYVSPELAEQVPDEGGGHTDPESLEGREVTAVVSDDDMDDLQAVLDGSDDERDSVTVRFERWTGSDPTFEVCAVDGEVVGCPPSGEFLGPADDAAEFARVLEELHTVTNRLYATDSIADGLDIATEAAVEVLGFDWCLLVEAKDELFEVQVTSENAPVDAGRQPFSTEKGIAGAVYRTGESRLTPDLERSELANPTHSFMRSSVTVPVGEWGIFQALSKSKGAFDEEDRQLAETLIAPLATTIERLEREAELRESNKTQERQRRQIEALHTVATRMKTADSRDEVYRLSIEAVEDILEFDICIIDEVEGDVLVPGAVGSNMTLDDYYEETPIDRSDNLGSLTYREGETFVVDDLHESGYAPANSSYTSAISLALGDWGVFQVVSEEAAAFDGMDCRLMELLAEHTVTAIDRIDRERELERRAQELEAQNDRLDEFASIVSHDLRNPLNAASLRAEHALRTGETGSLEKALDALDRMDTIIDNVLTLARQAEDVDELRLVDLKSAATRCWERVPADSASLTVTGELGIEADEDQLGHLFENLFRNAVEHGTTDPPSQAQEDAVEHGSTGSAEAGRDDTEAVTIRVGPLPDADGFYVEDDGPGIPADVRGEVFDRGYTDSSGGTGLGLAIVEEVVEAHGWEIRVTEGAEGGARFEVTDVSVMD
jgi:signal transduction histidine kinase